MPAKNDVLHALTVDELRLLADAYDLEPADRRRKDALVDAFADADLAEVLNDWSRDRLKDLCRRLDLDAGGRAKAVIVERILSTNGDEPQAAPSPKRSAGQAQMSMPVPTAPAKAAGPPRETTATTSPRTGQRRQRIHEMENVEAIEKKLWSAADNLRANSSYASNEYFLPVMGLVFLRHAYSRYLAVKDDVIASLPTRGGKPRALTKEDFSQRSAIYLRPEAQFDHLVELPRDGDLPQKIIAAMESIEKDYASLQGALPKAEYQELDAEVLGDLLKTLNPDELKDATGDVFGRIYEYFLTQFADLKAHDNGEFFTPVSLVSLIANVLEPDHGIVYDPACGSGGMFVQSAHFLEEERGDNPKKLTFLGQEKNATTIRLARMNLAVHNLEGKIEQGITYYEDAHDLGPDRLPPKSDDEKEDNTPVKVFGKADYVMANPPFNVDEVDAGKIQEDPRLPFGLPGVNKKKKVSNGNYLWISYFYSCLKETGRAGFVMSSQSSSAGRDEAKVRQQLVETGDVDVMISIRPNFFYTRTVPCELWFFDRDRPEERRDKVLMIDARNIYRVVTRKIYDFSPEQLRNILAIVWLYRGEEHRFLDLVADHLEDMLTEAQACFEVEPFDDGTAVPPVPAYVEKLDALLAVMQPFLKAQADDGPHVGVLRELEESVRGYKQGADDLRKTVNKEYARWPRKRTMTNRDLHDAVDELAPLAESCRSLVKQADAVFKLAGQLLGCCQDELNAKEDSLWPTRDVGRANKDADEMRQTAVKRLKRVCYFHRQAVWLTERFPEGVLCDVEGLVKLVSRDEIAVNDWSLTPGRYVGVALEEEDEDFDFGEVLTEIHAELEELNAASMRLSREINRSFEELGI